MAFDWDKYAEYVKSSNVLDVDTDERCALLDLHERVKALEEHVPKHGQCIRCNWKLKPIEGGWFCCERCKRKYKPLIGGPTWMSREMDPDTEDDDDR